MKYIFLVSLLGALVSVSTAFAQEAVIIQQSGSPLSIDTYSARYNEGDRYSSEGVVHSVTVSNNGEQDIVAYTVSFRSFDVFNEDMGRGLGGISIQTLKPGESDDGGWRQRPYAAFSFEKYGTGVSYVSRVRLADGTVWSADQDYVLNELQKIQDDLTADIFENTEE